MRREFSGGLFSAFVFVILGLSGTGFSEPVISDTNFKPQFKPTINISRVTSEIKVDGRFDEPGWHNAAVASNFVETGPGDNIKPPVESKAMITYDENNLLRCPDCLRQPGRDKSIIAVDVK